jgi:class 3 adenylate cyclase
MLDLVAVMDEVGSGRAALFGISEGGSMSALFAATHPQRVSSLALYGSYARPVSGPDHEIGATPADLEAMAAYLESRWGTGVALGVFAPTLQDDSAVRDWWARLQRLSASPGAIRQLISSYNLVDVRSALPLVQAPTLVLHRTDDRMIPVELGRELAEGIPDARLVEFAGSDHLLATTNWPEIVDELAAFITGEVPPVETDRLLATVLFTDIVSSTEQLGQAGDARWKELLDAHDGLVERQVARFGGRVVHGTGDGIVAVFDGPSRAIKAAIAASEGARALGISVRAGLHTGEILERKGGDVAGIAVHTAARVASEARADEVLVSRTTTDLVAGSGLSFEDRGERTLKGIEGTRHLFAVAPDSGGRPIG